MSYIFKQWNAGLNIKYFKECSEEESTIMRLLDYWIKGSLI